ncbi:OTU domain-containing protein DDB_G0284757-like isoform X1 [Cucurbita pepo subsp. pepo]|uniref:OTU domain-containing protein DDB_G0284757-like isoform X1 n=1 Tax=Cucurbita pepo subsp. pepo TaxID=3664 RepID=UPI000C9D84EC|nr:OTU domain-containing protein DDB_G0284757-like isoform X1 [Cucurbita pepo subsp. pepo]XP_023512466.1 OTU domain-containing protein DDB_G0284757-like isoform X1 [Cucurbita pepo subsp. pepo]XP_023512467.1 OTU domain-containing protein DDB_G0284757-like isoform X1 [Cucurbita pepo subsp. pepo]
MITHEQDPDVVRWGLELFDGNPFSNYGYCGNVDHDEIQYYQGQCFDADSYDKICNIENSELIAQTLQELSQLAVAEPVSFDEGIENVQLSMCPQDWFTLSINTFGSEHNNDLEEEDDSSCAMPVETSYSGDDWSYSLELTDEYALDGEVGKRLNQMVSIPHIPKINGEIPSVDEEALDHQRLLDRLQLYDLIELKVQGDGNCQFRALSDQIYRTPEHHKFVREQVVNKLKSCPEIYEGYVPMAYTDYLKKMSKSGEWGDHVTLQAAADTYGVKIFMITSFKDTCYIEILPNIERSKRVICLSFWAEVHYNSIYPEGDVPMLETRNNRWWMLQNEHHLE